MRKNTLTTRRNAAPAALAVLCAILACSTPLLASPTQAPHGTTPLGPSTQAPLLTREEMEAAANRLTASIAELNATQLMFVEIVEMMGAGGGLQSPARRDPGMDPVTELKFTAARAFEIGQIAESMAATIAAQDGAGDSAGMASENYAALAVFGYSLSIVTQQTRTQFETGAITPEQAVAAVSAYGARLWTPSVTGSPFPDAGAPAAVPFPAEALGSAQAALGAAPDLRGWLAVAPGTTETVLALPAPGAPAVSPFTPEGAQYFSGPDGQQVADPAIWAAAMRLSALTGQSTASGSLAVPLFNAAVLGSPASPPVAFPDGKVSLLSNATSPSGQTGLYSGVFNLDAFLAPTPVAQTQVQSTTPAVVLEITQVDITGVEVYPKGSSTFEAKASLIVHVSWTTAITNPRFDLRCGTENPSVPITTASGTFSFPYTSLLILYPGLADPFCMATSGGDVGDRTLGSAARQVLVGDAAGATARADQVETDSVNLNHTLTAEVVGTAAAEMTGAAATQAAQATINALETEVAGTQAAEFILTVTAAALQTQQAVPAVTLTPSPTATFTPVLVQTLFIPGDQPTIATMTLSSGRLYRICLSGTVFLTDPDKSVGPSDIMNINGTKVPVSGCMVVQGAGAPAIISCSSGTPAEDPGGFQITVEDLGPL